MKLTCVFLFLLFAQPKLLNQRPISLDILVLEVVQEAAPLSHQFDQAPAGMVIFGVGLKMIGQVTDTLAQDGHLYLGGAGIRFMLAKPVDNVTFLYRV
jgi:hypothetical protein